MSAARLSFRIVLFAALVVLPAGAPRASSTRTRIEIPERLLRGTSDGISVGTDGRLGLAPRIEPLMPGGGRGGNLWVWSVVADPAGDVYLGTGPEGRILRIAPDGKVSVFHQLDEPMVTALALGAGGELLAGTAPEGRIYRIGSDGRARLWAETGERYVWSLLAGSSGKVYAGTGERGRIILVGPGGKIETFFDGSEPHVVALARMPGGDLLAGCAGRGLLYRVDAEGHGYVIYDDDLSEVASLAVTGDGTIYAGVLASPQRVRRQPAVRIRLPDGTEVGASQENLGELQERQAPTLEGRIEGLPTATAAEEQEIRGRVVRIPTDEPPEEIWRSRSEAPYALGLDGSGRPLFGTGEPARIYRVDPDSSVSLLASLPEGQVTRMVRGPRVVVAATSNPPRAYRVETGTPRTGIFLSPPLDAGAPCRWGTVRWEVEGAPARVELYTRTGNSPVPDDSWSAWGPALTNPEGGAIVNPDGRFLQWRLRMSGNEGTSAAVRNVAITCRPHNRPPTIRDFALADKAPSVARAARFRWRSEDPDGDPVDVEIRYRAAGSSEWSVAGESVGRAPGDAGPADDTGKQEWTWDVSPMSEGVYRVQAFASDRRWNPIGEGGTTASPEILRLVVDRTPPRVEVTRLADGRIQVQVRDDLSPVARLELRRKGRTIFLAAPEDGVCDSTSETFRFRPPGEKETVSEVRAVDAAGNAATAPLPPEG